MLERIKTHQSQIFLVLVVTLTGVLGFGLGRLSRIEEVREPVRIIDESPATAAGVLAAVAVPARGSYVASKNGAKYYLLGCSGVNRIKEENKIYFATKEEAEKRGLTPATNCPGI